MLKGGSHLSNVFSFELNESLFFEKGQEVAEMRGISLDPEISIQTFNEYISIRGVIELRGEYQKASSADEEDEIVDLEDYSAKRFVERVVDAEDNGATFSHRFPVEISVPTYRVEDLNDVTVSIESFDYEIQEPSQLKLYSTIEIHGINKEIEGPRAEEKDEATEVNQPEVETVMNEERKEADSLEEVVDAREEKELEAVPLEKSESEKAREIGETFQFEIKEKQAKESVEGAGLTLPVNPPTLSSPEQTEDEQDDPDRWKYKQTHSQTLEEFFKKLPSQEQDATPSDVMETPSSSLLDAEVIDSPDLYESRESGSESESMEDVRYLSDMFRDTEEHQYTQMRLCIVQNQDTIETIAERYHVPALQLIKQNRLDGDYTVTEGQLLYIPDQKK